jgi:hypothetical protein
MKTIAPEKMLSLVGVDNAESDRMAGEFESVAPLFARNDGWLHREVQAGRVTAEQIQFNAAPAFLVWHHTDGDCKWINAIQSYDSGYSSDIGFIGIQRIAERDGCKFIRFLTIRGGLARAGRKFGFKPLAVLIGTE